MKINFSTRRSRVERSDKIIHPERIVDWRTGIRTLASAKLIVGLHPDGAAEAIIDFALQYNKPFAVVPCCTCSKDFPNRFLPEAGNGLEALAPAGGKVRKKKKLVR